MTESRPLRLVAQTLMRARWITRRVLRKQLRIVADVRWRLGDEIMAIPIYEGIKRRYPFCHLTVWCNHPDVLLRNPHVDRIVGSDQVSRLSDCDRYILLRGAPRGIFRLDHYARLAGIPTPPMNPRLYYEEWTAPQLTAAGLDSMRIVAICNGGTWKTKRWPQENWQRLCDALARAGHRIVQVGKDDDSIKNVLDLTNRTSVREAACVLRRARLLISNDSGLMHLALAVGTPVLSLFGPTLPAMLVRTSAQLTALTNERDCQGCWNRPAVLMTEGTCPLGISPCMGTIPVDTVLARAHELLGDGA
ncbi:MAG: glycosyltransferase family 9 protein [Candidatus Hydrogenedentes bacterium]|nr:glycosyltransferase family 9 protein [Candidatus Hydrogenedentota bacterium]